jgi:hypothetical protein
VENAEILGCRIVEWRQPLLYGELVKRIAASVLVLCLALALPAAASHHPKQTAAEKQANKSYKKYNQQYMKQQKKQLKAQQKQMKKWNKNHPTTSVTG